jgi:hypothetical protein
MAAVLLIAFINLSSTHSYTHPLLDNDLPAAALAPHLDALLSENQKMKKLLMEQHQQQTTTTTTTSFDIATLPVLKYMDSPKERDYIRQIHALPPTPANEKRVISFGLYGDNPKYTTGAIRNAELTNTYFPGWVCRFYVDSSVPLSVLSELKKFGAEIAIPPSNLQGGVAGMFWRFLVADDVTVTRFIVRDSDSRLNARDRFAVEEWITSGKTVHVVRDHVNHVRTMNGGLWGGKGGCVPGGIEPLMKSGKWKKMDRYMQDIFLLTDEVWPLIKEDQIGHDAYSCSKYPNSRPFPTERDGNYQHVGQVFDEDDNPRMDDIDRFIRNKKNPAECRPKEHQDWIHG